MLGIIPLLFSQRRGGAGGFDPNSIAGLSLWLKADGNLYSNDAGTTPCTDTNQVAVWSDASSATNNAIQTVAGKRLIYRTNQQNGLPGVTSTGSQVNVCVSGTNQSQPYTIFIVFKGHGQYLLDGSPYDAGGLSLSGGFIRARGNGGVGSIVTAYTNDTLKCVTSQINGASSYLQLNQGSQVTGGTFGVAPLVAPIQVGGLLLGAFSIEGTIFEVLMYSAALSNDNAILVQNYLNDKWNIF